MNNNNNNDDNDNNNYYLYRALIQSYSKRFTKIGKEFIHDKIIFKK